MADDLLLAINGRLERMFERWAAGKDVSPAEQSRCEGMIEAVIAAGQLSESAAVDLIRSSYQQYFSEPFPASLLAWQIPTMMRRAPVVPSTT